MNHHNLTSDYLHANLKVIGWLMNRKGLSFIYELDGIEYAVLPDVWHTTTLLDNCLMIENRCVKEGEVMVLAFGYWQSFKTYASVVNFSENDIMHLVVAHIQLKGIQGINRYLIANIRPDLN
jgi:hypothetical protein